MQFWLPCPALPRNGQAKDKDAEREACPRINKGKPDQGRKVASWSQGFRVEGRCLDTS